jgi:ketosteroid isomerase-like protein
LRRFLFTRLAIQKEPDMSVACRLTEQLFTAFEKRDIAAAAALINDDAIWRFPGDVGALAGEHQGREAIFQFLMKVAALTDGTFHADRIDLVGDDRVAFLHFIGRARRNEKSLENPTCLRLEFDDGKLVAATEWVWNLADVENFWS